MKAAFAMFGAVMLMGIAGAAGAQEGDLAALRAENAALRAELAMLRDGGGQCAPAGGGEGGDVALLLRKLSVLADQAALGLIAPPDAALRIPDAVLSAYVPGQFIFVLSPQAPDLPGDPEAIAAAYGLAPGSVRYVYGRVFRGFAAFASEPDRARLSADPRLQSVARDGYVFMAQTLPGFGGATAEPSAPAPDAPFDPRVDVYVFDSGIRAGHRAVEGRVAAGFTSFSNGIGTEDCNGHGTHVAASIGGRVLGQTNAARLISVKVMDRDNWGDVSTLIAGIEWVLARPSAPALANMSLIRLEPDPPSDALIDRAVEALIAGGIPVVVAAGNQAGDARQYSPARVPGAITVGAMAGEALEPQSNSGPGVDLYAEGRSILSASLRDTCAVEPRSGTSMATSRVTGFAARLMAEGAAPADLPRLLQQAARRVPLMAFAEEAERFVLAVPDAGTAIPDCTVGAGGHLPPVQQ